jgi:NTP pyrophosphatase (non-canonical NTP hydrolase)
MQFHSPKNLACSIAIEAAELLQYFQWKNAEESERVGTDQRDRIAEEIADVAIYLLELADTLNVDVIKAIEDKLRVNSKRYPIAKAKGKATKYTQL